MGTTTRCHLSSTNPSLRRHAQVSGYFFEEVEKTMSIQKYGRFWAVYAGSELICIAVYKKGAQEVVRRLTEKKKESDQ